MPPQIDRPLPVGRKNRLRDIRTARADLARGFPILAVTKVRRPRCAARDLLPVVTKGAVACGTLGDESGGCHTQRRRDHMSAGRATWRRPTIATVLLAGVLRGQW